MANSKITTGFWWTIYSPNSLLCPKCVGIDTSVRIEKTSSIRSFGISFTKERQKWRLYFPEGINMVISLDFISSEAPHNRNILTKLADFNILKLLEN